MPQADLDWTVIVYFAADNNLQSNALTNLLALSIVGSTDRVHMVAQIDQEGDLAGQRYFVKVGGGLTLPEEVIEPNTGSVEALLNFVQWVVDRGHKAKNYLVVLWGHGNGLFDQEDHESEVVEPTPLALAVPDPSGNGTPNSHEFHDANLVTSMMPDDTSQDSLTSRELREALAGACEILGIDKIQVLGMDACLMGMIEVAHQVSDSAEFMVSSETTIPNTSWPYGEIARRLTATPTTTPRELSVGIVDEYLAFYKTREAGAVTLSACDLSKTDAMTATMRNLGEILRDSVKNKRARRAIIRARANAQSFLISDYVDLFHVCERLDAEFDPANFVPASAEEQAIADNIRTVCQAVMGVLKNSPNGNDGFVFRVGVEQGLAATNQLSHCNGVSIYFPLVLPLYRRLEFSKKTNWDSFLFDYVNIIFRPPTAPLGGTHNPAENVVAAGGPIN